MHVVADETEMKETIRDRFGMVEEYLTFGRRRWRLIRVWILQIVLMFSEVQVFGVVHPWTDHVSEGVLVWTYASITLVFVGALVAVVRRMGQLTFAPWSREPRHQAVSVLGYLVTGAITVFVVWVVPPPHRGPTLGGGITALDLSLGSMVTGMLAVLLALGYYAQFDATDFPTQEEIDEAVETWLESLDWAEMAEGSREKERRYREFRQRSEHLEAELQNAVTDAGQRLRDDFESWRAWFDQHDRLSQEAVIKGSVDNPRLDRGRDRLAAITDRLEGINNRT